MPTRRQRHWLRAVSMLGACLSTTTAGTVYLFSTYGPALSQRLHLTSSQSNTVAICANYGLLLSGPFFGWAADTIGPRYLSAFAAVTSFVAFSSLAYTYSGAFPLPSWLILTVYMVLVGLAAQSANMAAVTTTTKNFKKNRGTAVSLCIAFFGLSPFVLSQIGTIFFSSGEQPDTFGYLQFLSYLSLAASTLAALSLSVVGFGPSHHSTTSPIQASAQTPSSEEESLIPHSPSNAEVGRSYSNDSTMASQDTPVRVAPVNSNGIDYDTARDLGGLSYVSDPEAQLLALVLFLCAGIGISYNNNVGTMVKAMYYSSVETPDSSSAQRLINYHVATVSLGSFLGRLSIGAVVDICKRIWNLPRSGILCVVALNVVISQVILGSATNLTILWIGSVWTGLSYGFIFGFVPTLVSVWFGTRHFGTNWGLTSASIGFSGQAIGAFFGYIYDTNVPDQDPSKCVNGDCYRDSFVLSTGVALLGLLFAIILARRRGDRRRENRRLWEAQEINDIDYIPFILAE